MGKKGKWLALALSATMAFAVTACSMVSVNEERDNAQVVAEVNGAQIKKDRYRVMLQNTLYNYGMTEESIESEKDPSVYKQDALDKLVEQELLYQQAEKEGLVDNSEAKREELRKKQQDSLDEMKAYYKTQAEENGDPDPEAKAEQDYQEYLKASGYIDMDTYINDQIKATAISDMYEKVIADATFTEEQAKEYYDEQVKTQQPLVEKDPKNFAFYQMGDQAYVNPAGSKYVKNLLIAIPSEVQTEISNMRKSGQEGQADALLKTELEKIKPAAEAALKRVKAGEDFDALIEELGEDPGMESEPGKTYGYLVYDGAQFVAPFLEASLAMQKVGDVTDLVATDYGYHIIKFVKDGAGPVDFEMIKDKIMESQLQSKQSGMYYDYMEELKKGANIKTFISRV